MKTVELAQEQSVSPRLADYLQLTRPRIGVMVLFTVAVGFLLASRTDVRFLVLFHTLLGTGLVACSASVINQWQERKADARMKRTANRPLPSGRIQPLEALVFGLLLATVGIGYLLLTISTALPALVAGVTLITYIGLYTPMKPLSIWNTVVGAFPGALPPVIGWCAARGTISIEAIALFLILFIWQLPHFFAIAWLYKDDYAAGGFRMLPILDHDGKLTGRAMIGTCILLLIVTMMPAVIGMAGPLFLALAIVLGVCFLNCAIQFSKTPSRTSAKHVLRASLLYLSGLMLLLLCDGVLERLVGA